jgi:Domain of unknown function (DUF6894)
MPRYHFHIVDGLEVFDSVGATLPNDEAARRHALELATNLEKHSFPHRPPKPSGSLIMRARFCLEFQFDGQPSDYFQVHGTTSAIGPSLWSHRIRGQSPEP